MFFLACFLQEPQTTVIHNPVDGNKVLHHSCSCHFSYQHCAGLMQHQSAPQLLYPLPETSANICACVFILQESVESANTTIEDEDVKGKDHVMSSPPTLLVRLMDFYQLCDVVAAAVSSCTTHSSLLFFTLSSPLYQLPSTLYQQNMKKCVWGI